MDRQGTICGTVQKPDAYDADHGRQDKSAASGRAHVVVWIGDFRHLALSGPAGAFARNTNDFNAPSAIPRIGESAPRHDDAGRRLQPAPRPHPSRQPGRQATEELRRRGDAGREEGRPPRPNVQAKQRDCRRSTFGRGRRAALSLASRSSQPARRRHGPDRAPPRRPLSLGAAVQACRLPQARGRHPRRRGRPDVRRDFRRRRHEGFRPSDARRTGIISGSRSRPRTRASWPTFVPSRASS